MCWVQRGCYEKCWTEHGEQVIRSGEMRALRFEDISTKTPRRQEPIEQQKGERSDSLSSLSHKNTHAGRNMGTWCCQNCIMHCLWKGIQAGKEQKQQALQEPGLPESIREKNKQEEMAGIQQGKEVCELRQGVSLQEKSPDDMLIIVCKQNGLETTWKIEPLPRLVYRPKNRIDRIRITGNIQVPQQMALAYKILVKGVVK